MATRRYLDVRYDVTDLDDEQAGQLALEAHAQAERSDGHPSVEVETEWNEVEEEEDPDLDAAVRAALERAHDRSYLKLGDDDLDVYHEEVVRALGIAEPVALVGNVIFEDNEVLLAVYREAGGYDVRDSFIWFSPYHPLFDPDDRDDGPLFLMYAGVDGSGGTVYAPACGDADELERRLARAFGDGGWTLDDHGQAVRVGGAKSLAHAGESCDDPDCEIHHPEVIEDANERLTALAWFRAGRGTE